MLSTLSTALPRPGPRERDQRGSASLELVVLFPVVLAILLLGGQAAFYHHARTVAIAAAQEGARAAGAENAKPSDGVTAATDFIKAAGGETVLVGASATSDRTPTTATVVVQGHSVSLIPGWAPAIRQSASVPVERLTAP